MAEAPAALPDLVGASNDASMALADALRSAAHKALDGGVAGAAAQVFNVGALIWLRTTVNYQARCIAKKHCVRLLTTHDCACSFGVNLTLCANHT